MSVHFNYNDAVNFTNNVSALGKSFYNSLSKEERETCDKIKEYVAKRSEVSGKAADKIDQKFEKEFKGQKKFTSLESLRAKVVQELFVRKIAEPLLQRKKAHKDLQQLLKKELLPPGNPSAGQKDPKLDDAMKLALQRLKPLTENEPIRQEEMDPEKQEVMKKVVEERVQEGKPQVDPQEQRLKAFREKMDDIFRKEEKKLAGLFDKGLDIEKAEREVQKPKAEDPRHQRFQGMLQKMNDRFGRDLDLPGFVKGLDLEKAEREMQKPPAEDPLQQKLMAFFEKIGKEEKMPGLQPRKGLDLDRAEREMQKPQVAAGKADLDLDRFSAYKFTKVSEAEVLAKQAKLVDVNPKYGAMKLDDLKAMGVLPKNKMVLGEVTIYCSDTFQLAKHNLVVGLVEVEGKVYPRLFYHSNSQGTWRVMPYASKMLQPGELDKELRWFGKGQAESDTQLPISLIMGLNKLPFPPTPEDAPTRLGQIVRTVDGHMDTFNEAVDIRQSIYLRAGAEEQFVKEQNLIPRPPNPKDNKMPADVKLHPDFSAPLSESKHTIPHYGEVTARVFASKDKSVLYMFYEAKDGKAFLGSVEMAKGVKINSFGVREKILELKNMDAPLLEYAGQIPPGSEPATQQQWYETDRYESNWNYVRELEIIQMYYANQGRRVPERV